MSCRRSTSKNSIRKSKSCCNSRYDSDSTSTSDSSSDSFDSSSCTSSDSSCGCYDCYNNSPKGKKSKGKAKKRNMRSKKTSKLCKSPCSTKTTKKKPDRRTKGSSSSCGCSKDDCSDMCSSDDECGYDCGPPKRRQKGKRVMKQPRQRVTTGRGLGHTSNDQK